MLISFFPKPRFLFISAIIWSFFLVFLWFFVGKNIVSIKNILESSGKASVFFHATLLFTPAYIWFYCFFLSGIFLFYVFWRIYAPHPFQNWSILGSGLIIFKTNFIIQISIVLNSWRGTFFDLIQKSLTVPGTVSSTELFSGVGQFFFLALLSITIAVLNGFFVRHYVFRWRMAMNEYFIKEWPRLRHIEGSSQRIQDDTMRFARITESLGINLVDSCMTLIAFLPLLAALSIHTTQLPLLGSIPYPLVIVALVWSAFGTTLLAITGYKLPGLEFKNQRVEAAFRKELVYGEDDEARAHPPTLENLFTNVRKNYFILYAHYIYFDMTRYLYLQADNVFAILVLVPTIAAGRITFGIFHQIVSAFGQVSASFQYLVNSWPTIIELVSIWKRLYAFEATLAGKKLLEMEREYLENNRLNH